MIIEKVDEEILLVIIKTFKIQSWVRVLHFFQDTWQPKLGEILNISNEEEQSPLVHDMYAIACKDENGKTVRYFPKFVSKQMHFFIKHGVRVEMKVEWQTVVFKRLVAKGVRNTPYVFCSV